MMPSGPGGEKCENSDRFDMGQPPVSLTGFVLLHVFEDVCDL